MEFADNKYCLIILEFHKLHKKELQLQKAIKQPIQQY